MSGLRLARKWVRAPACKLRAGKKEAIAQFLKARGVL